MTKVKVRRVKNKFFITENAIFDLDIDKHSKLIYVALCRYADNGGKAYPSMRRLAKDCSVSKTTIEKYIKELIDNDIVEKIESDKKFNVYRILDWINTVPAHESTVPAHDLTVPAGGTNKDSKKTSIKEPSSDTDKWSVEDTEYKLTIHLSKLIDDNNAYAKTPTNGGKDIQGWIAPIDKLMRLDGASAHHIQQVMDWCQQDNFWQVNILSTSKFRKKFPQLFGKAKKDGYITKSYEEQKKENEKADKDTDISETVGVIEN
jgi:hypothetical protein